MRNNASLLQAAKYNYEEAPMSFRNLSPQHMFEQMALEHGRDLRREAGASAREGHGRKQAGRQHGDAEDAEDAFHAIGRAHGAPSQQSSPSTASVPFP